MCETWLSMGCIPFHDPVEEAFFNEIIGPSPSSSRQKKIGMDSDIGVTV